MNRRRLGTWVAALALAVAVQGCADPATARVVDVYVAMLGHLVRQPRDGGSGARVLYLVDHADDPAIDAEPVHPRGSPAGTGPDQPRR